MILFEDNIFECKVVDGLEFTPDNSLFELLTLCLALEYYKMYKEQN